MGSFVWVVADGLAVLLFAFTVYFSEMGGSATLRRMRFVRCPRCGRHGLAARGGPHSRGCPDGPYVERLRHAWRVWWGALHTGHR